MSGWSLDALSITPPTGFTGSFLVWSSGDRMKDANNQNETVYADPGDGNNWIELANAAGAGHETIGISRTVTTRTGSDYILSLDYAGRLGYSIDYTQIGIYVDGVQLATYANTSPETALNWQSLSYSFTGTGQAQTILIQIEGASDSNGRGAMPVYRRYTWQVQRRRRPREMPRARRQARQTATCYWDPVPTWVPSA